MATTPTESTEADPPDTRAAPPALAFVDAGTFGLRNRLDAVLRSVGGWRRLPLVADDDLQAIVAHSYPCWHNPRGVYNHAEHEKLTASMRKVVLAPLRLRVAKTEPRRRPRSGWKIDRSGWLIDHGKRLLDARDAPGDAWPMAWWQSPYLDAQGLTPDADRAADAEHYAARITARLRNAGLSALVLGHGSYHPAALDLMVWEGRDTRHIRERFEDVLAQALPPFDAVPDWF